MQDAHRLAIGMLTVTAQALAQGPGEVPLVVNQELICDVMADDVRVIAIGDSFCATNFRRVFPAALRVWPIKRLSALAGGCHNNGQFDCHILAESSERVSAGNGYDVLREGPETEYFALPVRFMEEIYFDNDASVVGPDGLMYRMSLANERFSLGEPGRFTDAGDELRYRMLYWAPPPEADLLADVTLRDGDDERAVVDLRQGARQLWSFGEDPNTRIGVPPRPRQINATNVDIAITNGVSADPAVTVSEGIEQAVGSNSYFHFAGGVFYQVDPETNRRVPGLYYSYLSDDSWGYTGFGSDTPSMGPNNKVFSIEQLTHWLDVTTLDRDQRVVVIYYVEAEGASKDILKERMSNMLSQTQAACDAVGLTDVVQCIVLPHVHRVGQAPQELWLERMIRNRDAAYELASERPNVAAVSMFDATDGVLFDGSDEAKAWLLERGYDQFTYGDVTVDLVNGPDGGNLLDGIVLHPRDEDSAAFFASIIEEFFRNPADCDGNGKVNILDFICFLSAWSSMSPEGDCDGNGTYDILDFVCFQTRFQAGCR